MVYSESDATETVSSAMPGVGLGVGVGVGVGVATGGVGVADSVGEDVCVGVLSVGVASGEAVVAHPARESNVVSNNTVAISFFMYIHSPCVICILYYILYCIIFMRNSQL